jgi:hypothetical protein
MANPAWSNQTPQTLTVGSITGEHAVIINLATGDIIDIYDALARLVFALKADGSLEQISYPSGDEIFLTGGQIVFNNTTNASFVGPTISSSSGAFANFLSIVSGFSTGAANQAELFLEDSASTGTGEAALVGTQRQTQGSLAQFDNRGVANLMHFFSGTGTTGASGALVVTTGASFPAVHASVVFNQTGRGAGPAINGVYYDTGLGTLGTQWNVNNTGVAYTGIVFG